MSRMIERTAAGQFRTKERPAWANDPKLVLQDKDVERLASTKLAPHPRGSFEGKHLTVVVVRPNNEDVILQFGLPKPRKDFDSLLEATIQTHFRSLDGFEVDYAPELDAWALKMVGIQSRPTYSPKTHLEDFLWLVDASYGVLLTSGAR